MENNVKEIYIMRIHLTKMVLIMKATVICAALIISLTLGAFRPELQGGQQSFDLRSSAVVSLGFSSALCMVIYNYKKDKKQY